MDMEYILTSHAYNHFKIIPPHQQSIILNLQGKYAYNSLVKPSKQFSQGKHIKPRIRVPTFEVRCNDNLSLEEMQSLFLNSTVLLATIQVTSPREKQKNKQTVI